MRQDRRCTDRRNGGGLANMRLSRSEGGSDFD